MKKKLLVLALLCAAGWLGYVQIKPHIPLAYESPPPSFEGESALLRETVVVPTLDSWDFVLSRPFLVVMRMRGARNPFFAMWVDNAELLCKAESAG